MKSISNIEINKKQLEDYLSEFHPDMKVKILSENVLDFDRGPKSFNDKMKKIIAMPKFGKKTLIYWTSRGWSEEESLSKRIKTIKKPNSSPMNRDFWRLRGFNEEQIDFQIKSQRKMNKEYWIKNGFSDDQAILKVEEFQRESSGRFIKKLKSDKDFNLSVCRKRKNNINYWLDRGYSLSDSKKKQSDSQVKFSLDICIGKYGAVNGLKVWEDRQRKWSSSLLNNGNLKSGYSSISLELFDSIVSCLLDYEQQFIKYHNRGGEFFINCIPNYFLYDFTDLLNNKIIEFNGDVYHGNPLIFQPDDICVNYKRKPLIAKELWERDKVKIDLAKENGFEVLVIWESEYKKDRIGTLNKCLSFIKNNKCK